MKIGVLALQGDFAEHAVMLRRLKVEAVEVRLPEHLKSLDGLIIPGGESTTIGKLATDFGLIEPLRQFGRSHAIWGTQPLLSLMDITVERNAFGRQVDSFEADLDVPVLNRATGTRQPYHAIFIRSPIIESVGADAKVLASIAENRVVAAQQGHLLATSFHPELTGDTRFHEYFLSLAD
jgi:5'-phosphate synthase pdxT subunit